LDDAIVGEVGGRVAIDIVNIGFYPVSIARIDTGGAHPDDFRVVSESCRNRALNTEASCAIEVEFRPTGAGYRSALVLVATPQGQYTSAVLGGFAEYRPTFETTAETAEQVARPGEPLGLGGSGFPPNAVVSIGFDDGSAPFSFVTSNDEGGFLAVVSLPTRLRVGSHRLVATARDGAVSNVTIDVQGSPEEANPVVPGFGLG